MTQHTRRVTVPAARGEQETWLCEDDLEGVHVQTPGHCHFGGGGEMG